MAATAFLLPDLEEIHIRARLVFYGAEANHTVAQAIVAEINRMYNKPRAMVQVAEGRRRAVFVIEYSLLDPTESERLIRDNEDYLNNFIRLEKENIVTRSFMGFGLGDNVGHWIVSDQLGHSTTAAHEFGHGMGLDHPERFDYRGSGSPPPIMAPRGTLVDPQYQWESQAKAGEVGGTMNPIHRRVSVGEIQKIVDNLTFQSDGTASIGRLTNITFDKVGNPGAA